MQSSEVLSTQVLCFGDSCVPSESVLSLAGEEPGHGNKNRALGDTFLKFGVVFYAIFAAFTESITSNLAQRSVKVIHFDGNRKRVFDFI